jgi:hypothetical protein
MINSHTSSTIKTIQTNLNERKTQLGTSFAENAIIGFHARLTSQVLPTDDPIVLTKRQALQHQQIKISDCTVQGN